MTAFLAFLFSFGGAALQSCIGFGNAIFMMNFYPSLFTYGKAVILVQICSVALTLSIVVRTFRHIRFDVMLPILVPGLVVSAITAKLSTGIDTSKMKLALGVLLVCLSFYFTLMAKKLRFQPDWKIGAATGIVAGAGNGFFAIGGPPAVLFFVPALPDKTEYLATIQCYFLFNSLVALAVRLRADALASSDLPVVPVAILGAVLGSFVGYRVAGYINAGLLRRIIYAFIGINGFLIILSYFLK